ncbi:MAG: xylulokinase [Treponema sp.]|jgi:xylulokinase|nr:xylulokinase [Treponema sp.]
MPALLGIDLGTSSVRAMILQTGTREQRVCGEEYAVSYPQPYWAEQDPRLWYAKTCSAVRKLLALTGLAPENIQAVAFSGQMHGLVCLDGQGELLRPAIIWPDQRSAASIQKIYDVLGAAAVRQEIQNALAPGFLLASLYWLFEHEQETYKRIRSVMLPKDYIKFRLTGRIVTDYSDAAGSAAFNNASLSWSLPLLEALGLSPEVFPPCLPSTALIGTVTEQAAQESSLRRGTAVVNGGADQGMQAVGSGIIEEGVFACNIGTGGQISTTLSSPRYHEKFRVNVFAHVLPGKWNIMAAMLNAGASLKWLARQVLGADDYQALDREAEKIAPGCEGLIFLPYLTGERFLQDPSARGVFFGLTAKHNRFHLVRAVMEGVVFALRDCLDSIVQDMGVPCKRIVAAGGGAAGSLWPQIQADILERPLVRGLNTEQACLGAAIIAGVGAGVYPDAGSAVRELVQYGSRYEPRIAYQARYREYRALFQELYARNKDMFHRIGRL